MVTGELREQSRGVCLCSCKPPALNTNGHEGTDNTEINLLLSGALSKVRINLLLSGTLSKVWMLF